MSIYFAIGIINKIYIYLFGYFVYVHTLATRVIIIPNNYDFVL